MSYGSLLPPQNSATINPPRCSNHMRNMLARQEYYLGMRRGFSHLLVALVVLVSGALAQGPPPLWPPNPGDVTEGGGPCASAPDTRTRSEEHTSELQSRRDLVCRLLLE